MNQLIHIYVDDVLDYFRRLGGQGRYDGYKDFHSGLLILCLLFDLNVALNTHPSMWNETNKLPDKIKEKLQKLKIAKNTFEDFIDFVRSHLNTLPNDDLDRFEIFLHVNKTKYEDYLNKLD